MFKKCLVALLIVLVLSVSFFIVSCGTDVKPNYFIGMFRDEGDIDRLSTCLSKIPETDAEGNVVITADSECLIDLSKRDTSDPNIDIAFSEILNDTEQYLDKIVTFEAVVNRSHHAHNVKLYTNRKGMEFSINSHGADIVTLDAEGEEVDLKPNHRYTFKVRIYEIVINEDGKWHINTEFIYYSGKGYYSSTYSCRKINHKQNDIFWGWGITNFCKPETTLIA